jgi:hypothetical protein
MRSDPLKSDEVTACLQWVRVASCLQGRTGAFSGLHIFIQYNPVTLCRCLRTLVAVVAEGSRQAQLVLNPQELFHS